MTAGRMPAYRTPDHPSAAAAPETPVDGCAPTWNERKIFR